jgi:hypothetical protein
LRLSFPTDPFDGGNTGWERAAGGASKQLVCSLLIQDWQRVHAHKLCVYVCMHDERKDQTAGAAVAATFATAIAMTPGMVISTSRGKKLTAGAEIKSRGPSWTASNPPALTLCPIGEWAYRSHAWQSAGRDGANQVGFVVYYTR